MKDEIAEVAVHVVVTNIFQGLAKTNPQLAAYHMTNALLILALFDKKAIIKRKGKEVVSTFSVERKTEIMAYQLITGHFLANKGDFEKLKSEFQSMFSGIPIRDPAESEGRFGFTPANSRPKPRRYNRKSAKKKVLAWLDTAGKLIELERQVEKIEDGFAGFIHALENKTPQRQAEIRDKTLALAQETFDKFKAVKIPPELEAKPVIRDLLSRLDLKPLIPGKTRAEAPVSRHLGELLSRVETSARKFEKAAKKAEPNLPLRKLHCARLGSVPANRATLAALMLFPGNTHSGKLQYRLNAGSSKHIDCQSGGFYQLYHRHQKLPVFDEILGEFLIVLTVDNAVRSSHGGSSSLVVFDPNRF